MHAALSGRSRLQLWIDVPLRLLRCGLRDGRRLLRCQPLRGGPLRRRGRDRSARRLALRFDRRMRSRSHLRLGFRARTVPSRDRRRMRRALVSFGLRVRGDSQRRRHSAPRLRAEVCPWRRCTLRGSRRLRGAVDGFDAGRVSPQVLARRAVRRGRDVRRELRSLPLQHRRRLSGVRRDQRPL